MSFIGALFEFGSISFWGLMLLAGISISILVDCNRLGVATIVAIVTAVLFYVFGDIHPLEWVREHPWQAALAIPGYLVAAMVWGVIKWQFFLIDLRSRLDELVVAFQTIFKQGEEFAAERKRELEDSLSIERLSTNGRSGFEEQLRSVVRDIARHSTPEFRRERWTEFLSREGIKGPIPPNAKDHKARIIAWMTYWPASMAWTLVNDPIRHTVEFLYSRIGNLLQGMSDRTFADVESLIDKKVSR